MDIRHYKRIARKIGIFPLARRVYRSINADAREGRKNDLELFSKLLKDGDLVFDIGANMGEKATAFGKLGARVVAVEPNPNCATYLTKYISKTCDLTVLQAACGSAVTKATLNFSGTDQTSSLRRDWFALNRGESTLEELEVDVVPISNLIRDFGEPDYIKIDVEGFESEVLSGLDRQVPLLSFEYHLSEAQDIKTCLSILERLGKWKYNFISMNDCDFGSSEWVSDTELLDLVHHGAIASRGDVFAVPDHCHAAVDLTS
jgi:FkbM family methyltransferase